MRKETLTDVTIGEYVTYNNLPYHIHIDWTVAGISVAVAVASIALATIMYRKENAIPTRMKNAMKGMWTAAYNRFYFDQLYIFITHKIIFNLVSRPIAWFDRHIIDGTMDALASVTNVASEKIKGLQSGNIQMYVWVYLIGALLLGVITIVCIA